MSSLVAYEDSESEDEALDRTGDGALTSVQTGSYEQKQEAVVCDNSNVTTTTQSFTQDPKDTVFEYHGSVLERTISSLPQNCFDRGRAAQHKHFRDAAAPLFLPVTQGMSLPQPTLPHVPPNFGDGMNSAKRHCPLPSGVRPYIPKRQKLATSVETVQPTCPAEQVPGNQTRERQIFSDVSPIVKPYLALKPGTAGIPRKLQLTLGGHQGPVNTVQWCPVPHLSHLLLSASMDKTVKVIKATISL